MTYACVAETQGHGRCRTPMQEGNSDCLCAVHAAMKANGKDVPLAPRPARVLVKANINPRWAERIVALDIPVKEVNFQRLEEKHIEHAEEHGRQAYTVRKDIADSGVPVFGKDGGLQNASVAEPLEALVKGYRLADIHIHQKRQEQSVMSTVVLTFEQGLEGKVVPLPREVVELFTKSSWGYVHIWANPPKDDGTVIHTVNCSHRSDDAARCQLIFADGLWGVSAP